MTDSLFANGTCSSHEVTDGPMNISICSERIAKMEDLALVSPSPVVDGNAFFFLVFAAILTGMSLHRQLSWRNHPLYFSKEKLPVVPYRWPWFGLAFSFRADVSGFIQKWSDFFGTGIFGGYMVGTPVLFVRDPIAALQVSSGRIPQLQWQQTKYKMMKRGMGSSEEAAVITSKNRTGHSIIEKHLKNGRKFEEFFESFQKTLYTKVLPSLLLDSLQGTPATIGDGVDSLGWDKYSIMSLIGRAIFRTSAVLFLGNEELGNQENFDLAMKFDSRFLKLVVSSEWTHRRFRDECDAREALVNRMREILEEENRNDPRDESEFVGMSELFKEINKQYSALSMEDLSRYNYLLFSASILNTMPTSFWVLYELLAHKSAHDAILDEVMSAHSKRVERHGDRCIENSLLWSPSELDQMINLESLIEETLRLRSTTMVLRSRVACEDFDLKLRVDGKSNTYPVKKGTLVLSCPTLMHRDPKIFRDPTTFKWDRFLPRPDGKPPVFTVHGETLRRPVDAWGGGPTMCPGRRFAKAEIKAILATLLVNYEIRFPGGNRVDAPPMKDMKNGLSLGVPDCDVPIELRRRV